MKFQIRLTNQTKFFFVGGGYDQQLQRNASEKRKTDHIVDGIYMYYSNKYCDRHYLSSSWCYTDSERNEYVLVYNTQVNITFRARWLASSEVISQVLFTSEQPKKNKMAFVGSFSQIKLLFGPLVIQLVWYILKQLFTSVSVKPGGGYLPPLR